MKVIDLASLIIGIVLGLLISEVEFSKDKDTKASVKNEYTLRCKPVYIEPVKNNLFLKCVRGE